MERAKVTRKLQLIMLSFAMIISILMWSGVTAKAASSYVNVLGTNVDLTTSNADIKGDGHYSYNADTQTLTVRGSINHTSNNAIISITGQTGLTVYFENETSITSSSVCPFFIYGSKINIKSGEDVIITVNSQNNYGPVTGFEIQRSEVNIVNADIQLSIKNQNSSQPCEGIFLGRAMLVIDKSLLQIECTKISGGTGAVHTITANDTTSVVEASDMYTTVRDSNSVLKLVDCSFNGNMWVYKDSIGYVSKSSETIPANNCCIDPRHDISFNLNEKTGTAPATQKVFPGRKVTKPADPVSAGYKFDAWYTNHECTEKFNFNVPIVAPFTLYAGWLIEVKFDMNYTKATNVPDNQYVSSGELITKPGNPSSEGVCFRGWYKDEATTNEFDFINPITAPTTIYAKWGSHNMIHVPGKESTYTDNGNKEYYRCTYCHMLYSDSEGKKEITDPASVIIPVLNPEAAPSNKNNSGENSNNQNSDKVSNPTDKQQPELIDNKQKTTSFSKVTAKKKSLSLTWKKQTKGGIKGYEIQYSTDKKFKKDATKAVTIDKARTTSKTIKKLKSKTKYFVRIRTFTKKNGKKIYSKWSKTKSVRIK
ncbi:MAG: InlB B-repeat-containing protein [Lachnospiraceae bacterium]|nr:InlB B-repeat-containing protein [Lachnospiraceae bacterium]